MCWPPAGNVVTQQDHDVLESRDLGQDPGDRTLLEYAATDGRILVTIDTDFGELVYVGNVPHAGLVRLPDVPAERRIALMAEVPDRHRQALEAKESYGQSYTGS